MPPILLPIVPTSRKGIFCQAALNRHYVVNTGVIFHTSICLCCATLLCTARWYTWSSFISVCLNLIQMNTNVFSAHSNKVGDICITKKVGYRRRREKIAPNLCISAVSPSHYCLATCLYPRYDLKPLPPNHELLVIDYDPLFVSSTYPRYCYMLFYDQCRLLPPSSM